MQEKIHPFSSVCDVQKAIVPGYLFIHPETKNRIRTLHGLVIKKKENHDGDVEAALFWSQIIEISSSV